MEITDVLGISGMSTITIICLMLGAVVKHGIKAIPNEAIPTICAVFGAILGVIGYYFQPAFPAEDLFSAIAIGIVSGLGATGAHQVFHQYSSEKKQ